jgi:hypothetical protein
MASSYDPATGLSTSRTYACLVSATGATSAWASGVRQMTILSAPTFGLLNASNQSLSSPADPSAIAFSTVPSGGSGTFTYQWYSQDGIIAAPTGSVFTGWTLISGANANSYDPPAGVTLSRSYACFVTHPH